MLDQLGLVVDRDQGAADGSAIRRVGTGRVESVMEVHLPAGHGQRWVASRWVTSTSRSRSAILIRSCSDSTVSSSATGTAAWSMITPVSTPASTRNTVAPVILTPYASASRGPWMPGNDGSRAGMGVDHPAAEAARKSAPTSFRKPALITRSGAYAATCAGQPTVPGRCGRRPGPAVDEGRDAGRAGPIQTGDAGPVRADGHDLDAEGRVRARRRSAPAAGCRCPRSGRRRERRARRHPTEPDRSASVLSVLVRRVSTTVSSLGLVGRRRRAAPDGVRRRTRARAAAGDHPGQTRGWSRPSPAAAAAAARGRPAGARRGRRRPPRPARRRPPRTDPGQAADQAGLVEPGRRPGPDDDPGGDRAGQHPDAQPPQLTDPTRSGPRQPPSSGMPGSIPSSVPAGAITEPLPRVKPAPSAYEAAQTSALGAKASWPISRAMPAGDAGAEGVVQGGRPGRGGAAAR